MGLKTATIAAALLLVAGGGLSAGSAGAEPTEAPSEPTAAPASPTAAPGAPAEEPAEPATIMEHDGTYAVGTGIVPGTYSTAGPVEDGACYWKRVNAGEIIDNALTKKPQVVQIEPTDTEFKTNGCQPWQLTNSEIAPQNLDPAAARSQMRGYVDRLNLGSLLAGGGQVPRP